MKYKLVSGLGMFVILPVFAGARLPAVNMSAGAVSARAQYGAITQNTVSSANPGAAAAPTVKSIPASHLKSVSNTERGTGAKRNVVLRTAKKKSSVDKNSDKKISALSEYLVPNRPSTDLWARNDTPLRMPRADEFSLITSDAMLPEENINVPVRIASNSELNEVKERVSSMDAQLARLLELQSKAEAAVARQTRVEKSIVESPETIAHIDDIPPSVVRDRIEDGVKVSRMVVPRDDLIGDDVVVRSVKKDTKEKIQDVREDMTKMSPSELRRAFRKTFLSENKHLSTYSIDDKFDVASDMGASFEGFSSARDLSEDAEKIRPLEIKIRFRNSDSALSRDNYNLLSEYAGIVVANPKRAIQVAIPTNATVTSDARKLAARRLAIVEQVLRDTGVSEQRIVPVLSNRDEEGFVLRIISNEQYETLTKQKRNMFGDTVNTKTYKSMSW